MGAYITISGGDPVYQFTERWFARGDDALAYLKECCGGDVPEQGNVFPIARKRQVKVSHDVSALRAAGGEVVPDNELSSAVRDRLGSGRETLRMPTVAPKPPPPVRTLKVEVEVAAEDAKPAVGETTLKDLCAKLEIDPKDARAKLRKAYAGNERQRWIFSAADVPTVIAILKNGNGKKGE